MLRTAAIASLILLYGSLAIIYIAQPGPLLLALGGIVVIISLILAFMGGRREVLALGMFSILFSVAAASLIGEARWGTAGALLVPTLWMLLMYGLVAWTWRNTIYIPSGTVVMIRHPNGVRLCEGPRRILPPLPVFETHIVTMPLYELTSSFDVEKINAQSLQDVKRITIDLHYRVKNPLKVLSGLPNRARMIEEMAAELKLSPDQAMLKSGFWEKLLDRQIREETDNLVRLVVYEHINRAVDTSAERNKLAGEVQERLSVSVQRWGIEIRSLEFETVELDPEQIKRSKRPNMIKREIEDAERQATIEAQKIAMMGKAQAEVQAHAIGSWIKAIKDQGVQLSASEIEQIILNVLEERNERRRHIELVTRTRDQERTSHDFWRNTKERAVAQ